MIRGLYAAASGMVAQLARQDVYANNLANANSVGFRRGRTAVGQFSADLSAAVNAVGQASGGSTAAAATSDFSQGPLLQTQRTLDIAITGDAFFTVQTPAGQAFTRDGRFLLDGQNRLTDSRGNPVFGEKGLVTVPSADVSVAADGTLSCAGKVVDRLRLLVPVAPQPAGQGLFTARATLPPGRCTVTQGSLEQANVNPVQELTLMMSGYRLYEANATALRYQDETLGSLMKVAQ